ncbi:aspartyl protease family protein [Aerosakkonema funiforme]|uniref:Aspartyl protease family protein n=2 Tax=Oscillatoriophycideae TaxID=1301283 RepID=A0A926VER8_9CYAN|nr:aspartyl protease family protein [Aerosakkonema funiforme]MBD2182530.1 aspartyl protease family protein [Aerosakkonema funiforme FACHB-1375]
MPSKIEFPFSDDEALPTIPITLSHAGFSVSANALLDTGSAVNLLPYDIGLQLGVIWEEQTVRLPLAGNLAKVEARGVFVYVQIGNLEAVRLAFAWAQSSQVPLILGQTNFFREFDVCFQRSRCTIEIIRF